MSSEQIGRSDAPLVVSSIMTLQERWRDRGEAWRWPTRSQAAENLRSSTAALKRPKVLALIAAILVATLSLSWGMRDNSVPLVGAMFLIVTVTRVAASR